MRRICVPAIVALFLVLAGRALPGGEKGFFNAKDLEGWEGLIEEFWKVDKEGSIVGSAPKGLKFNTFLVSKKKYGDFELSFKVKMTKGANSGVQIRSEVENTKTFQCKGPQCDMGQVYWGSLYGEHFGGMMKAAPEALVKKIVKEGDWNDYSIKAVGKHVTIKLNRETTVDDDFPKMPETGIIAWQLHSGGPMDVIFKDIQFREIKSDKK